MQSDIQPSPLQPFLEQIKLSCPDAHPEMSLAVALVEEAAAAGIALTLPAKAILGLVELAFEMGKHHAAQIVVERGTNHGGNRGVYGAVDPKQTADAILGAP